MRCATNNKVSIAVGATTGKKEYEYVSYRPTVSPFFALNRTILVVTSRNERVISELYSVTHVPTGYRVLSGLPLDLARKAAAIVAAWPFDWSESDAGKFAVKNLRQELGDKLHAWYQAMVLDGAQNLREEHFNL